ncbi:hypothetical protein SAMN05660461_5642 [Chitinophaga ginsengisegetis]|uniref:DUF2059 domain-containing protein n=1 Tax=Chitinophaga ginsengisegetis TaxID=393003 RepID=A0A1T5PAJ8_9BACT|nr:DUF2059 domain-containing protein [Chitinophaga ginsengisegetis]SKD09750.1 hypothetical protein SAMN05660461_5642 [Chitinophaga ginsengisegetis]
MKTRTLLLAAMMICGTFAAKAQQDSTKQYQKIEQLFAAMNLEQAYMQSAIVAADQTAAGSAQLAGKKEDVRAFFIRYASYPACKNDLLKLYAKYYTTEEIEVLTAFYKTSAGKKQLTTAAQLQMESAQMMSANLQAHAEELNKLNAPAAGGSQSR